MGLSNTVALDFGKAVFGRIGGIVFAAMVAFSCFGALNGVQHLPIVARRLTDICFEARSSRLHASST